MKIDRRFAALLATACFGQTAVFSPASIVQTFRSNGTAITTPTASVKVGIAGSGNITLSPSTHSGGNWLSLTAAAGIPPFTTSIVIDPSGLPDGTYLGTVTAGSVNLPVTILVGNPGPQLPSNGITNAASYQGGAVSPGEIVTLFGTSIGPQIPYMAQVWDGVMTTKLAGARVWIDNTPAPIIYAYPNQLAVVVPYEVAGKSSVQIQVENLVARTPAFSIPVQSATPAFFTADGSGEGQLAALNQDNSVNSASNPATEGSIVVLYATGFGPLAPAVADGTLVTSAPPPKPTLPVEITIGGKTAQVLYAGPAPSFVAGAIQVNAIVPAGIPPGNAAVVATVGTVSSPDGCTIAVH